MRYEAVKKPDFNKIIIRSFRYSLKKQKHYSDGIHIVKEYAPCLSFYALKDILHDIKSCDKFIKDHDPLLTDLYEYITQIIDNPRLQ